jgi:hypothetical protein
MGINVEDVLDIYSEHFNVNKDNLTDFANKEIKRIDATFPNKSDDEKETIFINNLATYADNISSFEGEVIVFARFASTEPLDSNRKKRESIIKSWKSAVQTDREKMMENGKVKCNKNIINGVVVYEPILDEDKNVIPMNDGKQLSENYVFKMAGFAQTEDGFKPITVTGWNKFANPKSPSCISGKENDWAVYELYVGKINDKKQIAQATLSSSFEAGRIAELKKDDVLEILENLTVDIVFPKLGVVEIESETGSYEVKEINLYHDTVQAEVTHKNKKRKENYNWQAWCVVLGIVDSYYVSRSGGRSTIILKDELDKENLIESLRTRGSLKILLDEDKDIAKNSVIVSVGRTSRGEKWDPETRQNIPGSLDDAVLWEYNSFVIKNTGKKPEVKIEDDITKYLGEDELNFT